MERVATLKDERELKRIMKILARRKKTVHDTLRDGAK